jgi:hypothetical protein
MRPSLYTYEYARHCEWHPEHIESISKYTNTSEDERTGMLKVKGSRSMRRWRRPDRTFQSSVVSGNAGLTTHKHRYIQKRRKQICQRHVFSCGRSVTVLYFPSDKYATTLRYAHAAAVVYHVLIPHATRDNNPQH